VNDGKLVHLYGNLDKNQKVKIVHSSEFLSACWPKLLPSQPENVVRLMGWYGNRTDEGDTAALSFMWSTRICDEIIGTARKNLSRQIGNLR